MGNKYSAAVPLYSHQEEPLTVYQLHPTLLPTSEIKEWFTAIGPDHLAHANLYNEVAYEFFEAKLKSEQHTKPMATKGNIHWDKSQEQIRQNISHGYGDPSSPQIVPRNKMDKIRKGR